MKIYKLMTLVNFMTLFGAALIIYDVQFMNHISWSYKVGYIIITGVSTASFMLVITLLSKICPSELRGTMFSISGMWGSISIATF